MSSELRIDFWALDDDDTYLCPLPHVVAWKISLIAGQPGGIELEYPRDGLHFDVLAERVTRLRDMPIAIRYDGTAATDLRGYLMASDGDEVAESGIVTFTGHFLTQRLEEFQLPPGGGENAAQIFPDATAGRIMRDCLQLAQSLGYLTDVTWAFTDTHDSRGVAWTNQTSAEIPPGRDLLQVAQQLREWGMAEAELTSTLELRLYVPDTVGTDHTLVDPPVVLRAGRDVTDATRRRDVREAATDLLIAGADGVYVQVHDPTARARRGRQIGRYISQGNLTTQGAALAYGNLQLQRATVGVEELSAGIVVDPTRALPLRDLWPSDWVYTDTGRQLTRNRIMQLTVAQQAGEDHPSAGVVLGDLITAWTEYLQRQIDGLVGGQLVTGTSTPDPETDDGLAPAVPQGLGVDSQAYPDQDRTFAAVTADWLPVTENSNGSQITDLAGYLVRWRYISPELPGGWTLLPQVTDSSAGWDGVVAGAALEVQVAARDRWGHDSGWSPAVAHTAAADGTPPPVPSTPVVTSYLGVLAVTWDGKGSAGEAQPADFSHVEVHASQTAGFTPHRPLLPDGRLDTATSTTYLDRLSGAGTMPSTIGDYGQTWYAKLVAVDRSGNASGASGEDSALLVQAGDGDVSALSIGKLTAGIMSALMTISGIIRTAASGARVELDTTGLRCYASDDRVLFEFNIPTSALSLLGRFTAGASATSGSRIILDPAYTGLDGTGSPLPTQLFYSSAGTFGPGFVNAFNEGSGRTGVGFNSGPSQSGSDYRKSVLVLRTDRAEMMLTNPDTLSRRGGRVLAAPDRAAVEGCDSSSGALRAEIFATGAGAAELKTYTSGGADRARIGVYSSGAIDLYGVLGAKLLLRADGSVLLGGPGNGWIDIHTSGQVQIVSQGAVKAFVIDHPTDPDRWLVHGCTESPHAGVEYWGTATIHAGRAVVELPTYFEAATRREGRAVLLTPLDPADGQTPPSAAPAAATYPVGGRFEIRAPLLPDGARVSWLVKAIRADVDPFDVEPLRDEVTVRGDGPYRYITPARTEDRGQ
ncbi:hypothetical protein ACFQE5_23100 [Pseudonocardia hispaniensis]|uniref:Fibronectin type-III domain-containing protein n=1 Tax=Pseudonocardia hispaniensis TaxID=904933 RepID=A0ABW1J979_9PSEU